MGHGLIAPNPSFESQSKSRLLGFLGIISSSLHEHQLVLRRWPWTPYSLIHLYSILILTVAYHNILKSWRVLKDSFLSGICPGLLVRSSDSLSRTDRKLTLGPTKITVHAPDSKYTEDYFSIISLLPPLRPFSPVLMQTANSSKLSNNSIAKSLRATRALGGLW